LIPRREKPAFVRASSSGTQCFDNGVFGNYLFFSLFPPKRQFFVLDEKHKTKSTLKDTRRERKKKKEKKKKKTTASSCLLEREQRERKKDEWGREICGVWS
jgi:hypothetical protein